MVGRTVGRTFVGISGYDYASWRGRFYPRDLPRRAWLSHAAAALGSVELNAPFYSLQRPTTYARWAASVPSGFTFAVKGGRFITHMKKLKDVEQALANFYASGVLALGDKTGPFLWQLPDTLPFDEERLASFFTILPRSSGEAAALAGQHDARLAGRALTDAGVDVPYRHALEPRHPSFFTRAARRLLERHDVAFVSADSAGHFPMSLRPTASFAYVRLHGSTTLYASGYDDDEIATWAKRVGTWARSGRDVYVYFDNDALGHAPYDALRLQARLGAREQLTFRRRPSRAAPAGRRSAPRTRSTAARGAGEPRPHP